MLTKDVPEVLFVCVHNAGRSQMAAGLLNKLADGRVHVRTAGSDPAEEINPAAVEAMAEVGVDLSEEFPKPLTDEFVRAADAVITMGCGDACPIYPGKRYEDWELEDPAGKDLETVRRIRDEIEDAGAGPARTSWRRMPRPDLGRRALAEGLAAFALVFAGCGAIVANPVYDGALGTVGVALVFGLVIMVMVYATGHLSGAHINPAVTLAFTLTRHFPPARPLAYIAAQLAGADRRPLWCCCDLAGSAGGAREPPFRASASAVPWSTRLILTAFLMFVIMAVATDTRAVGAAAAIAIGGTVGLDALFGGPVTGASMNPARSIGPAAGQRHLRRPVDLHRRARGRGGARGPGIPVDPRN